MSTEILTVSDILTSRSYIKHNVAGSEWGHTKLISCTTPYMKDIIKMTESVLPQTER